MKIKAIKWSNNSLYHLDPPMSLQDFKKFGPTLLNHLTSIDKDIKDGKIKR